MKKIVAILSIVALTSCTGGTNTGDVKTDSTSVVVDSTKVDSTAKVVDSVKAGETK